MAKHIVGTSNEENAQSHIKHRHMMQRTFLRLLLLLVVCLLWDLYECIIVLPCCLYIILNIKLHNQN